MVINLAAAASTLASKAIPFIHGSSHDLEMSQAASWYSAAQAGDQAALTSLERLASPAFSAPGAALYRDVTPVAKANLQTLVDGGFAIGPNPVQPSALAPKYKIVQKASGTSAQVTPNAPTGGIPTWALVGGAAVLVFLGLRYFKRG